jgi:hypothetical protein
MSQENQFDRHFKDRLGDYSSPVNDGLWNGVLAKQKQKRGRRILAWVFCMTAAAALLTGLLFLLPEGKEAPPTPAVEKERPVHVETESPQANRSEKLNEDINLAVAEEMLSPATTARLGAVPSLPGKIPAVAPYEKDLPQIAAIDFDEPDVESEKPAVHRLIEQDDRDGNHLVSEENRKKSGFLKKISRSFRLPLLFEQDTRTYRDFRPGGCPTFADQAPPRLFIELLAGPVFAHRSLEVKNRGAGEYLMQREVAEESRYAFGAGLRASLVLGNGMAFRSGVQLTQINEYLEFEEEGEEHMKIVNIFDQEGNLIGTDTSYETGIRLVQSNNTHRILDIPLTLGYEIQRKRWRIGFNATAFLNVLFESRGRIVVPSTEFKGFQTAATPAYPAFRDQLGISFSANATFAYQLSPNVSWIVEPHVRVLTESVTQSSYPLDQRYTILGLWTGIRYKI